MNFTNEFILFFSKTTNKGKHIISDAVFINLLIKSEAYNIN